VGWSAAGDLFYMDAAGNVWRLDTGAGDTELVAGSTLEFESVLADAERIASLFLVPVVSAFEAAHGPLSEGQCLGFTTLPVLGGAYSVENRFALSVVEHAAFTGDVHKQIRDLPDGAKVRIRIVP
jgi:hypothetical protein